MHHQIPASNLREQYDIRGHSRSTDRAIGEPYAFSEVYADKETSIYRKYTCRLDKQL